MKNAFDLTAAQNELKKFQEYKDLSHKIDRYFSAVSFRRDIISAQASIDALKDLQEKSAQDRMRLGQALMVHAIMMYCRAAIEDGNGRKGLGVTKDFSKEQRRKHQDIVKLRNKSLAHFDVGEGAYGEDWINERVTLRVVDRRPAIVDVWSRNNYIARLVFDLSELCGVALETLNAAASARLAALEVALFDAAMVDGKLKKIIESFVFKPEEFYLGPEGVDGYWSEACYSHEFWVPRVTTANSSETDGPIVATRITDA